MSSKQNIEAQFSRQNYLWLKTFLKRVEDIKKKRELANG